MKLLLRARCWLLSPVLSALSAEQLFLQYLNRKVTTHMATTAEVLAAAQATRSAIVDTLAPTVAAFGPAVDAFEARITALIKAQVPGGLTPEQQAELDAALEEIKGAGDAVMTAAGVAADAIKDAGDGVDEADTPAA